MSQTSSFSSSFRVPRASTSRLSITQNNGEHFLDRAISQGLNFLASQNARIQRFTAQSNEVKEIKDLMKDVEESIMKNAKEVAIIKNQFDVEEDKSVNAKLVEHMKSVVALNARLDSEVIAYEASLHELEETWRRIKDHDAREEDLMREAEQARENELNHNSQNENEDSTDSGEGDDPMDGSRRKRGGRADKEKEKAQPKKRPTKKLNKNDAAIMEGARDLLGEKITAIKAPSKATIAKNPRVKELKRILRGDDSSLFPDEDIQADEVETVPVDPFTNKKIRNPVKNKTCGHVYDKKGVLAYIQSRTGTRTKPRCPTIGCNNKHLRKEDLEDDEAMRLKIVRIRALAGEDDESEEEEIEINEAVVNQNEEVDSGDSDGSSE